MSGSSLRRLVRRPAGEMKLIAKGLPRQSAGWARARAAIATALSLCAFGAPPVVRAGHEVTYYPAFYPSEITLTTLDRPEAAVALAKNRLHVYLGATPTFSGEVPKHLRSRASISGYVLLTLDPRAPGLASRPARCAAAAEVQAALQGAAHSGTGDEFVFHPYPVTPFHEDYLAHVDRAQALRNGAATGVRKGAATGARRGAGGGAPATRKFTIRAQGPLAKVLADRGWRIEPEGAAAGAALISVPADQVLDATRFAGWAGPPWIKEGWYEAWQLLAGGLDEPARAAAQPLVQRLMHGNFSGRVEGYNLERQLVQDLMQPCARVAVGFTLRHEFYNDDYSYGVENVASDSAQGLNSPVFIRTVKLKDYPWNGPLFVAMADRPAAAWNPVAGFSDAAGRFVWSVVADDAYMTVPESASWLPNRMDPLTTEVQQDRKAGIPVPPDALLPEPGTGVLRRVGPGKTSTARIVYRVLSSPFMDGTETEPADLLYPYALAFRWGGGSPTERDPAVAAATALVRERLAGIRIAGTTRAVVNMAGVDVPKVIHTLEVYVNHSAADSRQVAALAPPWSAVPWELLALCEEAHARGIAAFSDQEARRRGVPWLDLVRDPAQQERLRGLIAEFERTGYRAPALASGALAELVPPQAAGARWKALGEFARQHGHLLDTNGAYVLKQAQQDKTTFEVVRNFSYAVGLGTYNPFADAPSARVTGLTRKGARVYIEAELETAERSQRDLVITRAPFRQGAARGFRPIQARSELVVIGADGKVLAVQQPAWQSDGRFLAELPSSLSKGTYALAAAVFADENTAHAQVGVLNVKFAGR